MLKIRRFLFPQRNQIFVALTALLLPMIFLVIKYCDAPLILPEKWFGFLLCDPNADKTWYNFALGYVSAYLFYIVQVYIPTSYSERKAWLNIQPKLSSCVREWKEYAVLLRTLLVFEECGNVLPTEKAFRYYRICSDDNRPSSLRRKSPKGKPLRTPASCYGTDDLIKKAKEMRSRSQKMMDMQAIGKLDTNLVALLYDTDPVAFFQCAMDNLPVIKKLYTLRETMSEVRASEVEKALQESGVVPDDYSVHQEGSKVFLCEKKTGNKAEIQFSNLDQLPLHTSLPDSLVKMEADIQKLEAYCKLNSDITIIEMTEEERTQTDVYNALYHPAIAKAMKMQ